MRHDQAHNGACNRVRRYDGDLLTQVVVKRGLLIQDVWSSNVLLRPVVKWRQSDRQLGPDGYHRGGEVPAGEVTAWRHLVSECPATLIAGE